MTCSGTGISADETRAFKRSTAAYHIQYTKVFIPQLQCQGSVYVRLIKGFEG